MGFAVGLDALFPELFASLGAFEHGPFVPPMSGRSSQAEDNPLALPADRTKDRYLFCRAACRRFWLIRWQLCKAVAAREIEQRVKL